MAMPATQIRRGMVIVFEGDPVASSSSVITRRATCARWCRRSSRIFAPARTSSIGSAPRTRSTKASMETHDLEFLYQGGDTYHFMNTENYDQLEMDDEMLGDNAQWMQPGMQIVAEYYDGRPIGDSSPEYADARGRGDGAGDEDARRRRRRRSRPSSRTA